MRVPTVMWWPGRIPADKTCGEVVASMDLFATCAEISGAELPTDRVIDGKSLIRLLEAKEGAKSPHDTFFYRTAAVRSGKWKLIKGQLYNLEADIGEATNVAEKHPNVVTRLSALLAAHKKDLSENTRPPRRRAEEAPEAEEQEVGNTLLTDLHGMTGRILLSTARLHGEAWKHSAGNCFWREGLEAALWTGAEGGERGVRR